jgi:Fn3 associated
MGIGACLIIRVDSNFRSDEGKIMLGRAVAEAILVCAGCIVSAAQTPASPAAPTIATTPAFNGALIATLTTTTPGAKIYYTLDGSMPNTSSEIYQAPFLVASTLTVKGIAATAANSSSSITAQTFSPTISSGTLVWSDEFTYPGAGRGQPNPGTWAYDTGHSGFGNHEQETYCEWNSNEAPCSAAAHSAAVSIEGHLGIIARQTSPGVYTSARLKSKATSASCTAASRRASKSPNRREWPAIWLLGNNIATIDWPACGELDILEHIDGRNPPAHVGATPPAMTGCNPRSTAKGLMAALLTLPTGFLPLTGTFTA